MIFRNKQSMFLTLVMLFSFIAKAQVSSWDVLPLEGRNELFHSYLISCVDEESAQRKADIAASLASSEKTKQRQLELKGNFLKLLGELPEKTALNDTVTDTIQKEGYYIEKIVFESRPNFHVTANFYIPDTDSTNYPTVLLTCGHYPVGKGANVLQKLCILLAKNGIASLIVDPICQAERYQILNPTTGKLKYIGESGTSAHSRLDVGATLAGTCVMAYSLWDNHRAIDYLYSRTDVVDTNKIGCAGGSGGGAQASYLCAFDNRIKAAVITSFIMNEPTLFKTIGPQTGSQNLSYEGQYGLDHPEYITIFAPKPFMIIAASNDFFDITGTRETYAESKLIYDTLKASDHLEYFETSDGHDWTTPKRQKAVQWFSTWFYNDTNSVVEGDIPVLTAKELEVTTNRQVFYEFIDEKNITTLNVERTEMYQVSRTAFWSNNSKDSCLSKVSELIKIESYEDPTYEITETFDLNTYSVDKLKISSNDDVPVTGALFTPKNITKPIPAVLYVDGRGKKTDALPGGIIEKIYVDSGYVILAIDIRGFGETSDNPSENETKHGNIEHRNNVIALYTGKTMIGQRVADIQKSLDVLFKIDNIDTTDITIVGIDRAATSVLHTAALDPRVKHTILRKCDSTFINIVKAPTVLNNMTHMIPNALMYYDLPDLFNAIAPRTVEYTDEPVIVGINDSKVEDSYKINVYPNPVNQTAELTFALNKAGVVSINLFNELGKMMPLMADYYLVKGHHNIKLNCSKLTPGVYVAFLTVDKSLINTKKIVIAR